MAAGLDERVILWRMSRRIHRSFPALCFAALASGALAGQSTQAPERGADLVAVDFIAVHSDGTPVTDLTADEISIRISGRRRPVRSLQMIEGISERLVSSTSDLPLPFGTNAVDEGGRAFTLILDDDSFKAGNEAQLREAVDTLIARLTPGDRLSLVTMPYGGVKVPLTTEHARVRTALARLVGQASGNETGSELACRTRSTLESLTGYLDTRGVRDEPMTVLFITGGLAAPRRDAPVMMAPGMCELRIELFQQVSAAAGAARANFYVIQPVDMMVRPQRQATENIAGVGFIGSNNPMEGIEHLAGVTGGKMLHLTGSAEGAFGRVLRENAAYYLASITAERSDRTGRSQPLELRVNRPGVEVRTRPQITFPQPDRMGERLANPSAREMLSVARIFRDLPLRASAYTALEPGGKTLRVVTIAEPVDRSAKVGTLVAALYDVEGKLVSHWTAMPDELQRSPVIGAMPAEPGAYRLRVAAIDSTGRAGTADYEFEAEIIRTGPLRLSSLVLGLSREGRFAPRLQFSNEPVAIGYLELEGAAPGTPLAASLEIARTLNGPPMASLPLSIESAGENRYLARGAIPIATLEPGDYIVRAIVGVEGHAPTRVVRTLRKVR